MPRRLSLLGRALTLLLPVGLFALFLGCGGGGGDWQEQPGPKVVVSFAPLYCFAKNVAGDDAQVRDLMTTTGPHSFNPTDTDARLLRRADLFFINGLQLDNGVADTLKKGSGNRGLKVVELAGKVPADRLLAGQQHHGHTHGPNDPHIWLDPELAVFMVEGIRDELKAVDAGHAADYDRRAAEYVGRLRKLRSDGRELLKDRADRRLVTFHESLSYFARAFDLSVEGVIEKKPGVEPNSDELKELIDLCKEKKVRLIAVEPQYSSTTSARAILEALKRGGVEDAALLEIDPLETVVPAALRPDWYEAKMRENLDALKKAMK